MSLGKTRTVRKYMSQNLIWEVFETMNQDPYEGTAYGHVTNYLPATNST
jgi:hypothetical protein